MRSPATFYAKPRRLARLQDAGQLCVVNGDRGGKYRTVDIVTDRIPWKRPSAPHSIGAAFRDTNRIGHAKRDQLPEENNPRSAASLQ